MKGDLADTSDLFRAGATLHVPRLIPCDDRGHAEDRSALSDASDKSPFINSS